MNIIDAIKSGKRFRRANYCDWANYEAVRVFSMDEVLSNQWEVEKDPITYYDVIDAMRYAHAQEPPPEPRGLGYISDLVARRLGLEP